MPAQIVGAVGTVAGGVASGKGSKKAARIQAQAAAQQTAALQAMYANNEKWLTPTMDNGNNAQSRLNTLLGLPGGDGSDPQAILASTPGYQFAVSEALKSSNANAYASGMGNSGAALKELQNRANGLAEQNYNTYVGQVGDVANRGLAATSALSGVSQNYTNNLNNVTQHGADSQAANAVFQGNNLANMIKGVTSIGSQAMGSSYGGGGSSSTGGASGFMGGMSSNLFDPSSFASQFGAF